MTQPPIQLRDDKPMVVIVGRVNVGKSRLFNRLTSNAQAIVSPVPGTTRDRNLGEVDWQGKTFTLVDTGGVDVTMIRQSIQALGAGKKRAKKILTPATITHSIIGQTRRALQEADLILAVVDGQDGVMPEDRELALVLKRLKKPVLLVCNKIDRLKQRLRIAEFYGLGLGEPQVVSASNGSGSGDLLDEIVNRLQFSAPLPTEEPKPEIRLILLGKPNVGKSSLVNSLLGHERVIVSPEAQTTREPQDTQISYAGHDILLIDTAGLRKQARRKFGIETQATKKTLATLERADVVLFITDAQQPLSAQDSNLAGLLKNQGVGIILVCNKWDVVPDKTTASATTMARRYRTAFPFLSWAPLLFTSAITGHSVPALLEKAIAVAENRRRNLSDAELKILLEQLRHKHLPVAAKGSSRPSVRSLTQTWVNPPTFQVGVGSHDSLHFSYLRFIENWIRGAYNFEGVPIRITVKKDKR